MRSVTERFEALRLDVKPAQRPLARFAFMLGTVQASDGYTRDQCPFRPLSSSERHKMDDQRIAKAWAVARLGWRAGWCAYHDHRPGLLL